VIDFSIWICKIRAIEFMIEFLSKETALGHLVYVKNKKTKPHELGHWTKKKQLEVLTTYLALGNLSEASRLCNVPYITCKKWKYYSDWWKETIEDIQSGEGQRTDNKMSKVIDKALDLIVDRIEQGDYQYDQKTGKIVKIPLKVRDLERVASGLFDKRQLIRKQPTSIKTSDLNQSERLLQLAEQFAKFAGEKVAPEKIIDEYIDGDYDEVNDEEVQIEENNEEVQIDDRTTSQ